MLDHPRDTLAPSDPATDTIVQTLAACPSETVADERESGLCETCPSANSCLPSGMTGLDLRRVEALIDLLGPLPAGQHVFREGDTFDSIAAVRAGTIKTYIVDRNGREQVLGFHLPGELIGLSAIHDGRYPCNAITLSTSMLCRFSFEKVSALAGAVPQLQSQLLRVMSRDIGLFSLLAGDHSADERLAAFLVMLSRRLAARGFSSRQFQLSMPRTDIANYLRLAPETVSRVLRRFKQDGLLEITHRHVEVLQPELLNAMAKAVLRH